MPLRHSDVTPCSCLEGYPADPGLRRVQGAVGTGSLYFRDHRSDSRGGGHITSSLGEHVRLGGRAARARDGEMVLTRLGRPCG